MRNYLNTVHLIHAEMLHFSAFICQKIIVVVAPKQRIRACVVIFALFIISPVLFRGEIEVFEGNAPVVRNGCVKVVQVVENTVIGTADTVRHIAAAVKQNTVKAACFLLQLIRQCLCLLLCNKTGCLDTVNQQLKFLGIKFPFNNAPSPCAPIVLGFIAELVQEMKVSTDGLLLYWNLMVIVKVFNDFLHFDSVGFVCIFQKVVQEIQ